MSLREPWTSKAVWNRVLMAVHNLSSWFRCKANRQLWRHRTSSCESMLAQVAVKLRSTTKKKITTVAICATKTAASIYSPWKKCTRWPRKRQRMNSIRRGNAIWNQLLLTTTIRNYRIQHLHQCRALAAYLQCPWVRNDGKIKRRRHCSKLCKTCMSPASQQLTRRTTCTMKKWSSSAIWFKLIAWDDCLPTQRIALLT